MTSEFPNIPTSEITIIIEKLKIFAEPNGSSDTSGHSEIALILKALHFMNCK